MKNQELKNELEEKLIQIYPLFKKENYQDISTEDIINGLNDVSQQLQFMTGKLVLEDLPNDVPREEAITISIGLWKHMGKRLIEEIEKIK